MAALSTVRVHRSRSGFSLVELLVVVAIISLLVGLLLPAVQAARESARRMGCSNNLRQLALAVQQYEAAQSRLPSATQVSEGTDSATCVGCWDPWGEARMTGFTAGAKHGTSWILELLPYIEQKDLFDRWDRSTNVLGNADVAQTDIAMLYCPSRRSGIRTGAEDHLNLVDPSWRGGGTDYGGCYGRFDGFINDTAQNHRFADRTTPIASSTGKQEGPFMPNVAFAAAALLDGMSNTILLGELQRLRPNGKTGAANTYNRTSQDGWAVGGVATLFVTSTDLDRGNPGGLNNGFFESPGSDHVGGGYFAMADGSVHFVSEFIDARTNDAVFPLLGSMRDGASASIVALGH
jgi:prepilin-type N-terminal cleavage/methylation domain-containing protein